MFRVKVWHPTYFTVAKITVTPAVPRQKPGKANLQYRSSEFANGSSAVPAIANSSPMIITYLRGSVCWRNPDAAMNGKENSPIGKL